MGLYLMAGVHQQPDQSNYLAEAQTCKLVKLSFAQSAVICRGYGAKQLITSEGPQSYRQSDWSFLFFPSLF